MRVDEFDFTLPPALIATRPVQPRDAARLLVVPSAGPFQDRQVGDLPDLLRRGDLLVVNDTRVIPARLHGVRERAGATAKVELLLHRRQADTWTAFARPARKLRAGDLIRFGETLSATVVRTGDAGEVDVEFGMTDNELRPCLEDIGELPLPPYIAGQRPVGPADKADYQTVYAARDGAVAAPTAGLHFTPGLLAELARHDIGRVALTLHVGPGTFLPVKVDDIADHHMHAEWGEITDETAAAINQRRSAGGRIVAVGTTSLRLLESAILPDGRIAPFSGETSIFITPGHRIRSADLLLTNFHLPRSTLLMLVSAFSGPERIRAAYAHAIASGYRFYSYGDACLLERAA